MAFLQLHADGTRTVQRQFQRCEVAAGRHQAELAAEHIIKVHAHAYGVQRHFLGMAGDHGTLALGVDAVGVVDVQPVGACAVDLVARQDELLAQELLPKGIVVLTAEDERRSPRRHEEPTCLVLLHGSCRGYHVALRQRQHLRGILAAQEVELLLEGAVVRSHAVLVASHDVHVLVAGVPVVVIQFRGPNVDEVVHASLHEVALCVEVELFEGFGTIVSPPEPCLSAAVGVACSLVEGSPEDGYSLLLVVEEVAHDGVEVLVDDALLRCTLLYRSASREQGARATSLCTRGSVKGEAVLRRQFRIHRHAPMPDEAHDSAGVVPLLSRRSQVVEVALAEVLEVKNIHGRILPCALTDAVGVRGVVVPTSLTTGQHLPAPHLVAEIAVELPRRTCGLAVDGLRGDFSLGEGSWHEESLHERR